jgi:hypothetical protein
MLKSRAFLIPFVLLIVTATLYPPFYWGNEKLREWRRLSEWEFQLLRRSPNEWAGYAGRENLPVKDYGFLFGAPRKSFRVAWGWDPYRRESVPAEFTLTRELIVWELILEYVLAFAIALGFYTLISLNTKKEKV